MISHPGLYSPTHSIAQKGVCKFQGPYPLLQEFLVSFGILVLLKFSSILVPLTFLHLHLGSPMSKGHPKDFSSAGTINLSSTGTFLHLNAISYAFSSAGTF